MSKRTQTPFEKKLARGRSKFLEEVGDGAKMAILFIPAYSLNEVYENAQNGDLEARNTITAIGQFLKAVKEAEAENVFPACAACGIELDHDFAAFAIMHKAEDDRRGVVAPFCPTCSKQGPEKLFPKFRMMIEKMYPVKTDLIQ